MNINYLTIDEVIKKINEFVKIANQRELTKEEEQFRKELRQRYIELYKQNVLEHLKAIKIVDEQGKDITPIKLRKLKADKKDEK